MASSKKRLPPFRRAIARIEPYRVANPPHEIKLNQNEPPAELPPALRKRIVSELLRRRWSRYPDYPPRRLTGKIARFHDLEEEQVLVGHGSNELIYAVALATLERGRTVLLPSPSYPVAKLAAALAGARRITVPLDARFRYDIGAVIEAIRAVKPHLLFFPSPNNPTGNVLSAGQVEQIAGATRSLVVIDEAYREFSSVDLLPLLDRFSNLLLLRTFSKAYRVAGLRIGALLGDPEVLHRVERGKPPHSIDLFSQVAGEIVLDEGATIRRGVDAVVREREKLSRILAKLPGVIVYPSEANFLLLRLDDPARTYDRLLRKGILVRPVFQAGGRLAKCLRITIGTASQNRALAGALESILEGDAK